MYMRKNAKNCKLHIKKNPGRKLLGNMRKKKGKCNKKHCFYNVKMREIQIVYTKKGENVNKCNLQFFRFFRIDIWDFSPFYLINTMI